MNLNLIKVSTYEAARQHKLYCSLRQDLPDVPVMRSAYNHMRKGRPVLDIFAAMKAAGSNAAGEPRLAISRCGRDAVKFQDRWSEGPTFSWGSGNAELSVPKGTFDPVTTKRITAKVPMIPAPVLQTIRGPISRFHLLWEVEKWDQIPSDPILLLKLSRNLFVVMAQWDLTPLEQAIMNGK